MKSYKVALIFLLILSGCSESEPERSVPDRTKLERRLLVLMAENGKLKLEVEKLRKDIDDIKNSPEKLIAEIKFAFDAEKFELARLSIAKLMELRPETPEAQQAVLIKNKIDEILLAKAAKLRDEELAKKKAADYILAKSIANLTTSVDEVNSITWYQHRSSPSLNESNGLFAYIGKKGNDVWLRLKITYTADDWLFIKSYTFNIDGNNFPVTLNWGDTNRDNSGGRVWEWVDLMLDSQAYVLLEKIRDSKRTILRSAGKQYYKDRDISQQEKDAIKELLIAYQSMGGKPPR